MEEEEDMDVVIRTFAKNEWMNSLTYTERQHLIHELYEVASSGFGGTSPWSLKGLEESIDSSNTVFIQAKNLHQTVGFIIASLSTEELDIYMIVVGEDFKRQHIGTKLLKHFIAFGQLENLSAILLETRESNIAARKLYKSVGFEEVGLRKAYYSSPIEHAVVMRRELGKEILDC